MMIWHRIKGFVGSEAFSGLLLIFSFFLALMVNNTPYLYQYYVTFVSLPLAFSVGSLAFETTLISMVNDGLMSFFFLLIGLEMKYHLVEGEYRQRKKLALPIAAAMGGLIIPALIYLYFNQGQPTMKGWAIPIATDTAFILGILSFFKRVTSIELRCFIIGFSLIDDALGLLILALFYTSKIEILGLALTLGFICALFALNHFEVRKFRYYLLVGFLLWLSMINAGIHGTLSGAIVAFFIPARLDGTPYVGFKIFENRLRPLVNYLIVPIFIFVNSEIPLQNLAMKEIFSNVSLGIILGLFIGKQVGIFGSSYIMVKCRYSKLPKDTSWPKFYAISALGGVGFTLSLFIGGLTFQEGVLVNVMRTAIIIGSLLSAVYGALLLKYAH